MQQSILQLDPRDNVLIALTDLKQGERMEFSGTTYSLVSNVPAKHKFAAQDFSVGTSVIMYGVLVGKTLKPVRRGELLALGSIHHEAAAYHEKSEEFRWNVPDVSRWKDRNFVNLKQAFEEELGFAAPQPYRQQVAGLARLYREGRTEDIKRHHLSENEPRTRSTRLFRNVDGIKFLLHEGGCGGTKEDSHNLCGLIAGYIHHPNIAGATVLSLGCQHAQVGILREQLARRNPSLTKPLLILEQQRSGSEFIMLSDAIQRTFQGLVEADKARRVPAPLSHLCVGLKCGGSDGFSGISANPAIGHTSDLLVALGARTLLSEFPELCGVEQELINRAVTKEVGDRFIQLMREYAARARAVRASFDMNPSPGNMRDGLLTDAMKSAGAAKKGGTAPVIAVLDYPEYSTEAGLNLQCTPGNDVECVTAQVGAGASVVLFTS